jgi:hypothetical protein
VLWLLIRSREAFHRAPPLPEEPSFLWKAEASPVPYTEEDSDRNFRFFGASV